MAKTKAHQRYKVGNEIVPGVTTVLGVLAKPALVPWANKLGLKGIDVTKYVDDKAAIGTLAHDMITNGLIKAETDTKDSSANQISEAENSVLSWLAWEEEHKIEEVIFVEKQLVHQDLKFGGTNDIYAVIDGQFELIDLKTGNGIYDEHQYQVAALKNLLAVNGHSVDRVRILNIPRTEDESFQELVLSPLQLDTGWQIFLNCLHIYQLRKRK